MAGERIYGYELREPHEGERRFFQENPQIGGMAADDERIVLNPYSPLEPREKRGVAVNEAVRLWIRENNPQITFELTDEQRKLLAPTVYSKPGNEQAAKETILGRIISGDPTAGKPTPEQLSVADKIRAQLSGNDSPAYADGSFQESGDAPIDTSRPIIENPDGSFSTERTITIEVDGRHINIPTIVNGRELSEDDAVRAWRGGLNPEVGSYESQEQAELAALERSRRIGITRQPDRQAQPRIGDQLQSLAQRLGIVEAPSQAPAVQGVPGAADITRPVTWAARSQQPDYIRGSVETKQKIEKDWLTEVQDYAEKRYAKPKDQGAFLDTIYEGVKRTELPKRTFGELTKELLGKFGERTVTDVARPFAQLFGMSEEQDPNSIKYLFTEKGVDELRQAYIDTAQSARSKEITRIGEERLAEAAKEGEWAQAKAVAGFYADYPEMVGIEVAGLTPLILSSVLGGMLGRIATAPFVLPRVAAGKMTAQVAGTTIGRGGLAGTAAVYGPTFGAQTYDGIVEKLKGISPERWQSDPGYVEMQEKFPNLSHAEIVDRISRDRALWPSIGAGVVGAILGPMGLERALVGPKTGKLWSAIVNTVAEPTTEAIEQIVQTGTANAIAKQTNPEQTLGESMGRGVAESFILSLGPGGAAGAATLARGREAAPLPGAEAGAPEAVPGAPGAPGGPAAPGLPAQGLPAEPGAAAETQDRVVQAMEQIGDEEFAKRIQDKLGDRTVEDLTPEEQVAVVEEVAGEVLAAAPPAEAAPAPGAAPTPAIELTAEAQDLADRWQPIGESLTPGAAVPADSQLGRSMDAVISEINAYREREGIPDDQQVFPGDPTYIPPETGPGGGEPPPPGGPGAAAPAEPIAPPTRAEVAQSERSKKAAERLRREKKINDETDSLLTAIAKLGGMDRDETTAEWGTDLKDIPYSGVFGNPVLRKTKGLSIDDIGQQLSDLGYLRQDEHGKFDRREFEELFDRELRGTKQFAPRGQERQARLDQERAIQLEEEAAAAEREARIQELDLTPEDLDTVGYFDVEEEVRNDADQLVAALYQRFAGTDAEARIEQIVERAAIEAENDPAPGAFQQAIRRQLAEVTRGPQAKPAEPAPRARPEGERPSQAPPAPRAETPALELEQPTPGELARREAERVAPPPEAPPPSEFQLTGSDRAADRAIAQGQRELGMELEEAITTPEAFHESTPDRPIVYLSGLSRAADFEAALARGANVGVDINELSNAAIDALAQAVANSTGHVFVDSGAFSVFRANQRAGGEQFTIEEFGSGGRALNFDEIMSRYEQLAQAVAQADQTDSGAANARVFYVMPDIVGDQFGSLDLVSQYADFIKAHSTGIVPLQQGQLSLSQVYEHAIRRLGVTGNLIVGIPSNEKAASNDQIKGLIEKHGDNIFGIHFLGAASKKTLGPKLDLIKKAGWDGPTSADSNALRSNLRGDTDRATALRKSIEDSAKARIKAKFDADNKRLAARKAELVQQATTNGNVLVGTDRAGQALLTPSLSADNPNGVRVTRFQSGEPTGHNEYRTLDEAIGEFMSKDMTINDEIVQAMFAAESELNKQTQFLGPEAAADAKMEVIQSAVDQLENRIARGEEAPQPAAAKKPARKRPSARAKGAPAAQPKPAERTEAQIAADRRRAEAGAADRKAVESARAKSSRPRPAPDEEREEVGGPGPGVAVTKSPPPDRRLKINIQKKALEVFFPDAADKIVFRVAAEYGSRKQAEAMGNLPYIARYLGLSGDEALRHAIQYRQKVIDQAKQTPTGTKVIAPSAKVIPDAGALSASELQPQSLVQKMNVAIEGLKQQRAGFLAEITNLRAIQELDEATDEDVTQAAAAILDLQRGIRKIDERAKELTQQIKIVEAVANQVGEPSTKERIRNVLGKMFGVNPDQLSKLMPNLEIGSDAQINEKGEYTFADGTVVHGIKPTVVALYDPRSNKIAVIVERVTKGQERPILYHELFHKRGGQLLGAKGIAKAREEVIRWSTLPKSDPRRQLWERIKPRLDRAVEGRVGKDRETTMDEELLPYAIEQAVSDGYTIDPRKVLDKGVEGWLARTWNSFIRAIKSAFGATPKGMTIEDLLAAAYGAAQLELPPGFGTAAAPIVEKIARNLRGIPPMKPGVGALRAAAALRGTPFFAERAADLETGRETYVPELLPAERRVRGTRPTEADQTREQALADASREELEEAAAAPPPPGPSDILASSIFNFGPDKDVAIRNRDDLEQYARTKTRPNLPWIAEERNRWIKNIIDHQWPFLKWLEANSLPTRAWEKLKLVPGRLKSRAEKWNREITDPIASDIAKLAKSLNVGYDIAALDAGWFATTRHIPEANAALRQKFLARIAAGDASAVKDLRRLDETQRGLHPQLDDKMRLAAGGLTDREAAAIHHDLVSRYTPAQVRQVEAIADKIVAGFEELKNKAVASGQISQQALRQFPKFRYYVALTGPNSPVWDTNQASDAFGSYIAENKLRGREGRGGTVSESAVEALAERLGRVAAYEASAPFKEALNDLYMQTQATGQAIGLDRVAANLVQQPGVSDVIWNDPATGKRYIFRFEEPGIGEAILNKNREYTESTTLNVIDTITRKFARAQTQWVIAFGPINAIRDIQEKSILVRSRNVKDAQGRLVEPNALFKRSWKHVLNPETWRAAYALGFNDNHRASNATQIGQWSNELIEDGGVSTFGEQTRRGLRTIEERVKKEAAKLGIRGRGIQGWSGMEKFIRNYNLMFEIMSSLSVNAAMRELGVDRETASFTTLDLMNFQNVGAKTSWLRAMYAFFNPAVQSGFQIGRQLVTKQPGAAAGLVLTRGMRDFAGLMVASYFLQALMRLFSPDDPELGDELDGKGTWEVERNMSITILGVPVKIPVGFGLPQLAWGLVNSIFRWQSGRYDTADAVTQAAMAWMKSLYPIPISEVEITKNPMAFLVKTFTPTAFRPAVDLATNTDAWGNPLTVYYPDRSKYRSEQGKITTPLFWKNMAKELKDTFGLDVYPEHLKVMADTFMWGPPGYALQSFVDADKEKEGRKLNPFDEVPMSNWLRILGASRIIGGRSRYLEARYYDEYEKALTVRRDENLAKQRGNLRDWLREDPSRARRLAILKREETKMRLLGREFNDVVRSLQSGKTTFQASRPKLERIANARERAMRAFLSELKTPKWQYDTDVPGVAQ